MADLRKRFGHLVTAHRRRRGLTQEALAEAAELSTNMISKIEIGATGARFPVIERLAAVLEVEPAEFFTTEIASGAIRRKAFNDLAAKLATLSEQDLLWIGNILDAALRPRTISTPPAPKSEAAPKKRQPSSLRTTSTRRRSGDKYNGHRKNICGCMTEEIDGWRGPQRVS